MLNVATIVSINALLTAAVLLQFWKEVVEDTEVRELIWDKSSAAQGKHIWCKSKQVIKVYTPACSHDIFTDT